MGFDFLFPRGGVGLLNRLTEPEGDSILRDWFVRNLGIKEQGPTSISCLFGYFQVSLDSPNWTKDGLLTVCVPGQGRNPEGPKFGVVLRRVLVLGYKGRDRC